LSPICRTAGIEPERGVVDILERLVGGKHDAVRADHEHGLDQRLGVEISRSAEMEIGAEVIASASLPDNYVAP
jgi:hypothetical protein